MHFECVILKALLCMAGARRLYYQKGNSATRFHEYSRDQRPDGKQVCIGMVVTPEGLPLAYEVFAGNRADVTTVEDVVDLMEAKYGRAERIWAMDRGMTCCEPTAGKWRSLEMWLQGVGLGHCARQVLRELETIRSMDVVLPVRDQAEVRLRLVAKPEKLTSTVEFPRYPGFLPPPLSKLG